VIEDVQRHPNGLPSTLRRATPQTHNASAPFSPSFTPQSQLCQVLLAYFASFHNKRHNPLRAKTLQGLFVFLRIFT
jgi:hypothetical protein